MSPDGRLVIESSAAEEAVDFELEVTLRRGAGDATAPRLAVRAAPPARPISYLADLLDDIIRIFWDASAGRFRPIDKSGFDQYFRRLQAQGIARLIVCQSPFPYSVRRDDFSPEDWRLYAGQARAIVQSSALDEALRQGKELQSWTWMREILALWLRPKFGEIFTRSALEHGIALTTSFRPFEIALTKYYEVPVFDADGTFLRGFMPLASPIVNYHPDRVGFAHYRTILEALGKSSLATLQTLEIPGVSKARLLAHRFAEGHRDLEVQASQFPSLDGESFVLVRQGDGEFELSRYRDVHGRVRRRSLAGFRVEAPADDVLRITGLDAPGDTRFLLVSARGEFGESMEFSTEGRVVLRAAAGNRLGRTVVYWALHGDDVASRLTRVAGITGEGSYRAEFQAAEASITHLAVGPETLRLGQNVLVIDRGGRWSHEMVDFSRAAAWEHALAQLRTMLSLPAFDEIFINTRSHTQLAASMGDGDDGLRTIWHHHRPKKSYGHLGIDRAYAPFPVADDPLVVQAVSALDTVEKITTWKTGEWKDECQSSECGFPWRLARTRAVARGVRRLLADIERTFPGVRVRAVLPPRAGVIRVVRQGMETLQGPDGVYDSSYFRHIRGSLNHIPAIGEGMSIVDLTGLSVEPVFLGIRFLPDQKPLELYVDACLADMAGNLGSRFRGPRSFFYEAQETLRSPDVERKRGRREEIVRFLLSRKEAINEVILYEAADWAYYLSVMTRTAFWRVPERRAL